MTDSVLTPVDRLYEEAAALIRFVHGTAELSLEVAAADNLRKGLLLGAASYFEKRVCETVLQFVRESANGSRLVEEFVRNTAIARQYYRWFSWDASNANSFFGLFGDEFRAQMTERVNGSEELGEAIKAFLEIGSERNKLVHQDYATFPLEKTLEEIYALYRRAVSFVDSLPTALRGYDSAAKATAEEGQP